jgi:hypothetical protein
LLYEAVILPDECLIMKMPEPDERPDKSSSSYAQDRPPLYLPVRPDHRYYKNVTYHAEQISGAQTYAHNSSGSSSQAKVVRVR